MSADDHFHHPPNQPTKRGNRNIQPRGDAVQQRTYGATNALPGLRRLRRLRRLVGLECVGLHGVDERAPLVNRERQFHVGLRRTAHEDPLVAGAHLDARPIGAPRTALPPTAALITHVDHECLPGLTVALTVTALLEAFKTMYA
jgi:hypothetical protein